MSYDTCNELDELERCDCGNLADVAIDGKPECPVCLSERTDHTGSWIITARNSRKRIKSKWSATTEGSDTDQNEDADREIRTDGGNSSSGTYRINGEHIPVEQVDEFDGDLILSTDVTRAVNEGFDFADIWRHVSVEVDSDEETFTATVVACEIEHGMAAIRLTDFGGDRDAK